MDPTACWHDICNIVHTCDTDDASILVDRLRDLADWIDAGGFFPDQDDT